MTLGEPAAEPDERGIHAALLAGLLSHVGMQVEPVKQRDGKPGRPGREYLGTRNTRFVHRAGHPAGEEAAALGGRRRAGRDQPAVRPHRRADRPRDGREAGRPPGQAAVLRAPVGRQARLGRRHRAGHALRPAARRRPAGAVRLDRPGRLPGAVHPARPRAGRVDDAPPLLGGQPARDRAGRRAGGAGPPAGHRASTTRRCSSSTTPASPPTSSPPGTSTAGGRRPAARRRTCSPSRPEMLTNAAAAGQVRVEDYPDEVRADRRA